jgi:hypothetical protein
LLISLEKGDKRTPKGTHRVPKTVRSKALSESANRKALTTGKMGKTTAAHHSTPEVTMQLQAPLLGTCRNFELHAPPTT